MTTPATPEPKKPSNRAGCGCAFVLFAVLVGYFAWPSSSPSPSTTTATPSPTSFTAAAADAAYADFVRQQAPDLKTTPDPQLDAAGRSVCADAANGTPLKTTALRLTKTYSQHDAGTIIGLAADAFCPDQKATINAGINTLK